jgi:predicted RNA-binding protein
MAEEEKKRKLEQEFDLLAEDGINCTVENDKVTCTSDILKREKIEIPKEIFSVEEVRKRFAEKETPP